MISQSYWSYFLVLENDFFETTRFVEMDQRNNNTFSLEYTKLLLSVGSEIDVICKELCKNIKPTASPNNIKEYMLIIKNKFPKISTTKVEINRYNIESIPWHNWENDISPDWWKSYNKVKHNRIINYNEANQKNVTESIAGLLVLLLYLYRFVNNDEHKNGTKLFDAPGMGENIICRPSTLLPDFE